MKETPRRHQEAGLLAIVSQPTAADSIAVMKRTAWILWLIAGVGCGSVDDDVAGDPDGGVDGDDTAPTIVSFSPENGSNAVFEERISIEFSEPMDQSSVELAFEGGTFSWNAAGTEVDIDVPFPFAGTRIVHLITVPETVTDLAGNPMAEAFTSSITLAALIEATIDLDGTLSGNASTGCSSGTFVQAGDNQSSDANCPSTIENAGISFSLAGLPPLGDVVAVRNALVRTQLISTAGDPADPTLGAMVVDHILISARGEISDPPTVKTADAATFFAPGDVAIGDPLDLDVLSLLEQSWEDGDPNFQLRIRPSGTSNADDVRDLVRLRRTADENDGIVDPSLPEPDAGNRMRLEIEYFE